NAYSELTSSQSNLGPIVAAALGLENVRAFTVESSGASGGAAVQTAFDMISSNAIHSALVIGVEKMRDLDPLKLVGIQGLAENADYFQFFGISFSALNALLARLYMSHYDVSREKLSAFPVISHKNSSTAEHAQFKKKFTAEEVSRSELVADPIRVLDCAPVGDGAAAVLLVADKQSEKDRSPVIQVAASESSSASSSFFQRNRMLHFGATEAATKKALRKSGMSLNDIGFFEIHDSYSIMAALIVEAMGLSKAGEGCSDASSGKFDLGGKHPISTFGGMKGRGYPVGAAGVYQVCEGYLQLSKKAGANQVPNSKSCLLQSASGIDASSYVHVLSRKEVAK
ncbi:MAG: hypothetical protein OK439_03290, partial [Thaumarchaeota archaeon]|nr:hypothetical protein [Nitrososphaerota archaeon]